MRALVWIPGWTDATDIDDYVARWVPVIPGQYNIIAIEPDSSDGHDLVTEIDAVKAIPAPVKPTREIVLPDLAFGNAFDGSIHGYKFEDLNADGVWDSGEPGLNGWDDAAFVPDFDIPQDYINQHSREYRMDNRSTTDDHGVHIIGCTELDGRDWYLIKESSSRGHWGKHIGYMFYRDDYVRLKMMEFAVHRDAVADLLKKFAGE